MHVFYKGSSIQLALRFLIYFANFGLKVPYRLLVLLGSEIFLSRTAFSQIIIEILVVQWKLLNRDPMKVRFFTS